MAFGFHNTAEDVTEGLDLSGKTFLVTGINSGLGFETVRVLAMRGASIIGAARTEAKAAQALAELGVDGQPIGCELGDLDSVSAAAADVQTSLDGLIANAGIMALPERVLIRGIEAQFATNHLGHFHLVTSLLDRLAPKARVVVVASDAHIKAPDHGIDLDDLGWERGYLPWQAYGASKLANILFARALSRRLKPGQVANSLHPGVIQTQLGRHVPDRDAMYARMKRMLKTVEQGAATQCYVATHPREGSTRATYFSQSRRTKAKHPRAEDDDLAEALWAHSQALMG
ncbi:MAG: SDR family NAD(P)-dependent oxidoreductase [Myxococcota bacterium]